MPSGFHIKVNFLILLRSNLLRSKCSNVSFLSSFFIFVSNKNFETKIILEFLSPLDQPSPTRFLHNSHHYLKRLAGIWRSCTLINMLSRYLRIAVSSLQTFYLTLCSDGPTTAQRPVYVSTPSFLASQKLSFYCQNQ